MEEIKRLDDKKELIVSDDTYSLVITLKELTNSIERLRMVMLHA